METAQSTPRLAPPGAGIPFIERLVGGTIFAIRRRLTTRERIAADFARQREAIARMYRAHDNATLAARVLIPRLRGLEDSSRFWSVLMTLDHLRIVNSQITRVIKALTHGRTPEGRASTAAVKPRPDIGPHEAPQVAAAYEQSCDQLIALASATPQLKTSLRFAHPWFGPLDGAGWHAMVATHMGIHRAQIARILEELARRPA